MIDITKQSNTVPLTSYVLDRFKYNGTIDMQDYSDLSVNDNAQAQIKNEQERTAALETHDHKWSRERDKLSNSSAPFPSYDLGSREHRSLHSEYEERRTNWEYERAIIDNIFSAQKGHVREQGQTLSHEFSVQNKSNEKRIPKDSFIADKTRTPVHDGLKDEFSISSKQSGRHSSDQGFTVSHSEQSKGKSL